MIWALAVLAFGGGPPAEKFPEEVREKALSAAVRVVGRDGTVGSGAVIGREGQFAYVLTAAHVVRQRDGLKVVCFPKEGEAVGPAEVVDVGKNLSADLALLRARVRGTPGVLRVCPAEKDPPAGLESALAVGCPGGQKPEAQPVGLTGVRKVRRSGVEETAEFWASRLRPLRGASGGPLVDRDGRVIGVCSAASGELGLYARPDEIRSMLRAAGLQWLYEGGE